MTANTETIGDFGPKQFDLSVDGSVIPVGEVTYGHWTGDNPTEVIAKWSGAPDLTGRIINYTIRVNGAGKDISSAVVSDTLSSPGMSYVEDSFTITRGSLSINPDTGGYQMTGSQDVTGQYSVDFSADKTSFSISLEDIETGGFYIRYQVELNHDPVNQEKFLNTTRVTGNDGVIDNSYDNGVVWQTASGEANGYNYSIAINKIDESGNALAGAIFSVVRDSTGAEVSTIITAADGTGSLGGLLRDAYTIHETTPPDGYMPSADVHISADELNNDSKTATVTITNKNIETVSTPVAKKWVGGEGGPVTVRLLADGADTGQALRLSGDGGWEGSFGGLPKRAAGEEIAYTVAEDAVEGYSSEITGDAAGGFTVTNTKGGAPGKPGKPSGKSGLGSSLARTGDGATPPAALLAAALAGAAATLLARRRMLSTAGRGAAAHARRQKR